MFQIPALILTRGYDPLESRTKIIMLRRNLLRALLTTPLAGWLRPWTPLVFGGAAVQTPNAATIYRRVFDWMKLLDTMDRDQLRNAATIPVDDQRIRSVLDQAARVLKALREAAKTDRCDWGIETFSNKDLVQGPLDATNLNLVRLACLSARRYAKMGQGEEALDDVFAGLTLAQRIGSNGLMISRLLGHSGEVHAFKTIGRILPILNPSTLNDLSRRLDQLPRPEPASAMIEPESRFILGSIRARLITWGPVIQEEDWAELGFAPEETLGIKRLTHGDRAALLAHLNENGPAFAELARRLDLPRPQCRAALDRFARTECADHPLVASFIEKAWNIRDLVDRGRALRAILHAAIALLRDGEAAFGLVADPFGNGPFLLQRRVSSHRIRSALSDEGGQEVALTIGDPS